MLRIVALAALMSAVCLVSGCADARSHVVGTTEGDAHRRADAQCRAQGKLARVHEWIANSLAYECVERGALAQQPTVGLTYGPL